MSNDDPIVDLDDTPDDPIVIARGKIQKCSLGPLHSLIAESEAWLMQRVLDYAKQYGYTQYTSTLLEAWRASIEGLSQPLLAFLEAEQEVTELQVDMDFANDPAAAFGVLEANRHRERGITLGLFLGLFKYYRQGYMDLLTESDFDHGQVLYYQYYLGRYLDLVEVGFCAEWAKVGEADRLAELQTKNRELTNEKNRYLTIFESIEDPVLLFDQEGDLINANYSAISQLLGRDVSGGVYYDSIQTYQLQDKLENVLQRCEAEQSFETELDTSEGKKVYVVHHQRMLDISDKFLGMVLLLNDVTELHELQQELQQAREDYRTIADFTNGWEVWEWPLGVRRYVSPGCEVITGYSPQEFIDDSDLLERIMDADDWVKWEEHRKVSIDQQGEHECLFRVHDRQGEEHWIDHICQPVYADDGSYKGQRSSNRDVTERIKAEEELDRYRLHLEELVEQRTRELDAARKLAESANHAKSIFMANMSHELHTPLNAILGFNQLMQQDRTVRDHWGKGLNTIQRSGDHLLLLIDDLLAVSRFGVDVDEHHLDPKPLDLFELLNLLQEAAGFKADEKGLELLFDIDIDVPQCIIADEVKLRQVLKNLLYNGVKYTDAGRVQIKVDLICDTETPQLSFAVMDTGYGIAEEEQESIFEPFYQTEAGVRLGEGLGVGLSVSREYVRLMGGELQLSSTPGKGSRFFFSIPVEIPEEQPSQQIGESIVEPFAAHPRPEIDLSSLSADLLEKLYQAALSLDQHGCENVLKGFPESDESLVEALADLVEHYRFNDILKLMDRDRADKEQN